MKMSIRDEIIRKAIGICRDPLHNTVDEKTDRIWVLTSATIYENPSRSLFTICQKVVDDAVKQGILKDDNGNELLRNNNIIEVDSCILRALLEASEYPYFEKWISEKRYRLKEYAWTVADLMRDIRSLICSNLLSECKKHNKGGDTDV